MKELVAGLDGGGSKTRLVLATETGEEVASVEGPKSAMQPGEAERSGVVVAGLMRQALSNAGVLEIPTLLYAGFAGVGREEDRRDLANELNRLGVADEVVVDTDASIALIDAFGTGPGIMILSGTGSIAYGRGNDGTLARCGGWGTIFGDEGSGAWLGKRALGVVAAAADGREGPTALTGSILTAIEVSTSPEELTAWAFAASTTTIASLAPDVMATAAAGDPRAIALVSLAAEELVIHVRALSLRLFGDERATIPVAFAGGLLKKGTLLRKKLEQRLRSAVPGAQLKSADIIPVRGAVRAAIQRIHLPTSP